MFLYILFSYMFKNYKLIKIFMIFCIYYLDVNECFLSYGEG